MDTHEALRIRQLIASRHVTMMRDPTRWPLWPYLPLNRPRPGDRPELGILCAAQAVTTTVFLINLFDLGVTIKTMTDLRVQPQIHYDSYEKLYDDGWRVD